MHLNPFDEEKILLRFGVLSDCHLGMEPSEDDKKLQKLLRTFLHMAGSATSSGCTPDEARAGRESGKADFRLWPLHPQDTCYGSFQVKRWEIYKHEYHWTTNNLCHVLNRFPQAVFFSGHTHFPVADERSIWQGGYTSINTGSSSYLLSAAGGADAGRGAVCASVYGSAPSEYALSGACDGL